MQARSQSFRYFINISDFRARRSPRRQAFRIPFGYSRPEKPSLIRTLASPKTLPLGKMQVNLLLPSLIRNFGCTEDTPPRKKCKRACFFLSAYSLWLRRRNGAFRVSGPFAGPPAIRVWNRSFLFHRRVFQILRLGKNASELAFFSRLIHFGCGAVTALLECRDLLPGRGQSGFGTIRSYSIAESFRYSRSAMMFK